MSGDRSSPGRWRPLLSEGGDAALLITEHLEALATITEGEVQGDLLKELIRDYMRLEARVDGLLKNTLPPVVAEEIKHRGRFTPRSYRCSILFTDLVRFTRLAEVMAPDHLLEILDRLFCSFVTYDERSGILFSSDLFGSFATHWDLHLRFGEACYNCTTYEACPAGREHCPVPDIIDFQRKVFPSSRALSLAMERIREVGPRVIGAQHGGIISRGADIRYLLELLGGLEGVGIDGIE